MIEAGDDPQSAPRSAPPVGLLALALTSIWATTAIPVEFASPGWEEHFWRAGVADILANLILYVPLGVALRRYRWTRVLGIAAALSVGLEWAQVWYPDRFTAVTDVAANVSGAFIGYGLSVLGDRRSAWGLDPIELTGPVALASVALFGVSVLLLSLPGRASDFSNWDPDCRVIAGDELTHDRRWEGDVDVAAVFSRSFDNGQIAGLSALDPGETLDAELARLTPLFLVRLTGRVDSVRGVPLLDSEGHERFFRALAESGRISVVVSFRTRKERQFGPARIFGFSKSPYSQNFSLGQEGRDIIFRLRTPTTVPGGFYPQARAHGVLEENRSTVAAATYDGRNVRVYVDGRPRVRLNLSARGRLSSYFADTGLPTAAVFLGLLMGVPWVAAAWRSERRSSLALWGTVGGLMGGAIFALAGGARALPEFSAWVPILSAWGGGVVGGAVVAGEVG